MDKITSRAVLGEFKRAFETATPPSWVTQAANTFNSNQKSEEYPWLSATPALREWVGGRNAKGFTENSLTIINKHFEATLELLVRDMRRDKFGMIQARVNDLVKRAMTHPASLLSTLILAGPSTACYDGSYFFDTSHSEGSSGTQDNDLSVDISALPATVHGSTTNPSVEEMQIMIAQGIAQMMGFKDSAGEPMNESASSFLVMVPTPFYNAAMQAVATPAQIAASQTVLTSLKSDFSIQAVINPRLTWTTSFAIFRTDSYIKPFIFQRETEINVGAKAEGSEFEFDNDAHQYGVDYWGNVAFGLWQHACYITMT
jgi:phage major head subunit gpT-like protein